ncbi:hypothetical protein GCM10010282_36050 [Streptomyces roseolus]|nr:hypothetical protein GCM10010282_36050 [Streptomyces roseolus]
MTGAWTAPSRASAKDGTAVSIRVGGCQATTVPGRTPMPYRPAAQRSARCSTSSQSVREAPRACAVPVSVPVSVPGSTLVVASVSVSASVLVPVLVTLSVTATPWANLSD